MTHKILVILPGHPGAGDMFCKWAERQKGVRTINPARRMAEGGKMFGPKGAVLPAWIAHGVTDNARQIYGTEANEIVVLPGALIDMVHEAFYRLR
jgi:hypothetical protein